MIFIRLIEQDGKKGTAVNVQHIVTVYPYQTPDRMITRITYQGEDYSYSHETFDEFMDRLQLLMDDHDIRGGIDV